MRIRVATTADVDAVHDCLVVAFERYRNDYTPAGFLDTVPAGDDLAKRMRTMNLLVAAQPGGRIVGTIAYQAVGGGEGHLRGMAVLPALQGTGVAAALLTAAEEGLRAAGCSYVTLDTTKPLERAIRFYERLGYRPTGVVADFHGMPLYEYAKSIIAGAGVPR
ncbi:MAG TPA: GNAT family N-acetyltransferase [Candidatus Polarisedimenticolia bacterium]|nr:GNAT family N-acetyltransferase [Candidatus Polarisedimenticolia bacterium]